MKWAPAQVDRLGDRHVRYAGPRGGVISAMADSLNGMARPRLARVHKGIVVFWVVVWAAISLSWWSQNAEGGGFITSEFVVFIALFGFGIGVAVVTGLALVARFVLVGETSRSVFLVGIPIAILVGLLVYWNVTSPRFYPADTFPSGVVVGYLPEGYLYNSEEIFSPRGDFSVFRPSTTTSGDELIIGVLLPGEPYLPGETIQRGELEFIVSVDEDQTVLRRSVDGVQVEVSSNALDIETLILVAENVRYDPEWDVRD